MSVQDGIKQNTMNVYSITLNSICDDLVDLFCRELLISGGQFSYLEYKDWLEKRLLPLLEAKIMMIKSDDS